MSASALLLSLAVLGANDADVFTFDARLAAGPAARLDRGLRTNGFFEIGALFRIRLDGGHSQGFAPVLMPELSYYLTGASDVPGLDHAGVIGCGYGVRYGPFVTGVVPGIVIGNFRGADTTRTELGGGLRVLAVAEIEHFVGIQAGYVAAIRGGDFVHEVHASLSLNFLGLAVLYIAGSR